MTPYYEHAGITIYHGDCRETDQEAADRLGLQRCAVNARRSGLIRLGLVDAQPKGTRKNPTTGITNSTWGLA